MNKGGAANINMLKINLLVFACALIRSTCADSFEYRIHPLEQLCKDNGYEYGTCLDTLDALETGTDPNRCIQEVACIGKDFWGKYYMGKVSRPADNTPCGPMENNKAQLCLIGHCSTFTLDKPIIYARPKLIPCIEYLKWTTVES